jgi:hypothetical protein
MAMIRLSSALKLSGFLIGISYLIFSCTNNDLPNLSCDNSTLAISTTKTNPPDCASKGSIQITAAGGEAPYSFAVDDGDFLTSAVFTNLLPGLHLAQIKDKNGCTVVEEVDLDVESSTLAIQTVAVVESGCKTSNGTITVSATGGNGSLTYSKDNIDFSNTTGIFTGLPFGPYSVFVKDADGCIDSDHSIYISTGVSYLDDIKPILEVNCIKSGCHNGDNGAQRNWSVFSNVQAKALKIKEFTGNGTMPLDIAPTGLPQNQRDLIACWVDDGAKNN